MIFTKHASAFRPASLFTSLILTAVVVLGVGCFPFPATAQEAAPEEAAAESATLLEDIVVTAQKREQLLQDVPAAGTFLLWQKVVSSAWS